MHEKIQHTGPEQTSIINGVSEYYSAKIEEHGPTPRGVDWNGPESQNLRYEMLSQVLPKTGPFSILDYGCGYGGLLEYLKQKKQNPDHYAGFDISPAMLSQARLLDTSGKAEWLWDLDARSKESYDYVVASGIFSVKLAFSESDWTNYVEQTLETMHKLSHKGFAFNCLTSYSDEDRKRDDLYYPSPEYFFGLCKQRYSRNIALLHDYDLYEFTILVRKDL